MQLRGTISARGVRNSHALVVDELGRAIVAGTYPVGEILPGDADLAESFQVSRTVLREAMKTLRAKGMVFPRAGIGTRVTERSSWNLLDAEVLNWHFEAGVDEAFLGHLSDMRLSFEPQAARLATRAANAGDIARIRDLAEGMRRATTTEEFAEADLAFHMAVLDASRNPFMFSLGALIEAALASVFKLSSPTDDPPGRIRRRSRRHRRCHRLGRSGRRGARHVRRDRRGAQPAARPAARRKGRRLSSGGPRDARRCDCLEEVIVDILLGASPGAPHASASAVSHVRGASADVQPVPPGAAPRHAPDGSPCAPPRATGR